MKKLIIAILFIGVSTTAYGKAYYSPCPEMIEKAHFIAIVDITDVKNLEPELAHGSQEATATVEKVIKGEKVDKLTFLVHSSFPCGATSVNKGRHLIFLEKVEGKINKYAYMGCNWHLSYRPIKDNKLLWFADNKGLQLIEMPLDKVLVEISNIMKQSGGKNNAPIKKNNDENQVIIKDLNYWLSKKTIKSIETEWDIYNKKLYMDIVQLKYIKDKNAPTVLLAKAKLLFRWEFEGASVEKAKIIIRAKEAGEHQEVEECYELEKTNTSLSKAYKLYKSNPDILLMLALTNLQSAYQGEGEVNQKRWQKGLELLKLIKNDSLTAKYLNNNNWVIKRIDNIIANIPWVGANEKEKVRDWWNANKNKFINQSKKSDKEESSKNPILLKIEQALQPVLKTLDNNTSYEHNDKVLIVKYNTRKYMIHTTFKTGKHSDKAIEEEGPSFNGFLLWIDIQKLGTVNQAEVPQTVKRPYWKTDLNITSIKTQDKQLYWGLSYGSQTDKELLNNIKKVLSELEEAND